MDTHDGQLSTQLCTLTLWLALQEAHCKVVPVQQPRAFFEIIHLSNSDPPRRQGEVVDGL